MTRDEDDPYADLKRHAWPDSMVVERRAVVAGKLQHRRRHFIRVPIGWFEKLDGATGQTYRIALCLLYLDWKGRGAAIRLSNGLLGIDSVSRQAKWRGLADLERRGLIVVERRPRRAPVITLNLSHL